MLATFSYAGGVGVLVDDEPEIDAENYFQGFALSARCVSCRRSIQLVGLEL